MLFHFSSRGKWLSINRRVSSLITSPCNMLKCLALSHKLLRLLRSASVIFLFYIHTFIFVFLVLILFSFAYWIESFLLTHWIKTFDWSIGIN